MHIPFLCLRMCMLKEKIIINEEVTNGNVRFLLQSRAVLYSLMRVIEE